MFGSVQHSFTPHHHLYQSHQAGGGHYEAQVNGGYFNGFSNYHSSSSLRDLLPTTTTSNPNQTSPITNQPNSFNGCVVKDEPLDNSNPLAYLNGVVQPSKEWWSSEKDFGEYADPKPEDVNEISEEDEKVKVDQILSELVQKRFKDEKEEALKRNRQALTPEQVKPFFEVAPEDLALATVPGTNFDPTRRQFSTDELKPQPIIRKRAKSLVPDDAKDDRYWQRRLKNNVAARRSREARRLKENQIALRAAFLERENVNIKKELDETEDSNQKISIEIASLKTQLSIYERNG